MFLIKTSLQFREEMFEKMFETVLLVTFLGGAAIADFKEFPIGMPFYLLRSGTPLLCRNNTINSCQRNGSHSEVIPCCGAHQCSSIPVS